MSARTDALVSQSEIGKIALRSSFPVAAGCHPAHAADNAANRARFSEIRHEHSGAQHKEYADGDDEEKKPAHRLRCLVSAGGPHERPNEIARSSAHHAIDRGDRRCGDAERDHHADDDFIAVKFRWRHAALTAPMLHSFRMQAGLVARISAKSAIRILEPQQGTSALSRT